MDDKIKIQNTFSATNKKYPGTGNPDISAFDFKANLQKDLIASNISNNSRLNYIAVALNENPKKTRINMLNRMSFPLGLPNNQNN